MDSDNLFMCPICRGIPVEKREAFLEELKYKTKLFEKGECVVRQGDSMNALYILSKGSVKTEMVSESGAVLTVETINAPNPLAPAFLFAEHNRCPVDVVALEPCEVVVITKESIMKQLSDNEAFLQGFMRYNANRVHFLSERVKVLSTKTIKGKLAQYILSKSQNQSDFTMDKSQTALASYFGVTRPSLARALSEMVSEGVIVVKGRQGRILDFGRLRGLILQC
jgi:CRP-like cAMP-binding protein